MLRAMEEGREASFQLCPKAWRWVSFVLVETGAAERNLVPARAQCIPTTTACRWNFSSEVPEPPVNCFLSQLLKGSPHSGPRGMRQMCSFPFCRLPGELRSCRLTIVGENMFPHVVGYLNRTRKGQQANYKDGLKTSPVGAWGTASLA